MTCEFEDGTCVVMYPQDNIECPVADKTGTKLDCKFYNRMARFHNGEMDFGKTVILKCGSAMIAMQELEKSKFEVVK